MEIRKATLLDLEALTQLCITTFIETYAAFNTPENLQTYLEQAFNVAQLTQELQSPSEPYYLLYEQDTPIAFIKLNHRPAPTDNANPHAIEIQRIYVLQAHQGKGLGKKLLEIAETEAMNCGASALWLGVWEKNPKAIQFYEKNGFRNIGTQHFWVGNDCQTDFVMLKTLKKHE